MPQTILGDFSDNHNLHFIIIIKIIPETFETIFLKAL